MGEGLVREQLANGGFGLDSSEKPDPFTTALALELFTHLSYLGHHRERINCGNALLQLQQENGGWAGDYILRIPAPHVVDPNEIISWNNADGGGNSLIEDKEGLFATAMACYALACWRHTETQDPLLKDWPVFNFKKNAIDIEVPEKNQCDLMDWQSHFGIIFFETWKKTGLPDCEEYIAEYIDIREHGDFKNDWMSPSTIISPVIDGNQLRSVYGFGALVGKVYGEMLGLTIEQTKKASDWCGRFNLGISLFDYICDELEGVNSVTSLEVFQPFVKANYTITGSLTPAQELLSNLAGTVLYDLKQTAVEKDGINKADKLFKTMKRMFEAENFVSKENLSVGADLKKIENALYRKSAEPFRVMAEFTALLGGCG